MNPNSFTQYEKMSGCHKIKQWQPRLQSGLLMTDDLNH